MLFNQKNLCCLISLGLSITVQAQTLPAVPSSPAPVVSFEYDLNGNQTKSTLAPGITGFGFATVNTYDPLGRVTGIKDPKAGITSLGYDGKDLLTSVKDPRNLSTGYTRNGLGSVKQLSSPDTGVANSTFDAAGNLKTRTDSRGVLETWTYDALSRPTQVVYSQTGKTSETRQWVYDSLGAGFPNGIGRLVKWAHDAGMTTFEYDALGRLSVQTQTVNAATGANTAALIQRLNYGYDGANHLTSVTYPTGRRVDYVYVNGQLNSVKLADTAASLTPQTLLSTITWEPFGQISSWKWNLTGGATQDHTRVFDSSGRWVRYRLGSVIRDLSYDAANRITQYTHYDATTGAAQTSLNQSFLYDELGRLTQATSGATTWTLSYDANGNRTSLSTNGVARAYTVSSTSNRLQSLSNPVAAQTQDAAGNTLSDASKAYTATYNLAGRMSSLLKGGVTTTYTYDTGGQRIRKFSSSGAASTVIFAYDMAGHLMGEYTSTGAALREYIWLGDTPVAMFTATPGSTTPTVFYLHTDHLNTPRVVMSQGNQLRWRWLAEPFGSTAEENNPSSLGVFTQNLRFPGQYADSESGLYYNYFRDYDSSTGRYVQSDPIGLGGGINTYAYVGGNPLSGYDPEGEQIVFVDKPAPPGGYSPMPGTGSNANAIVNDGPGRGRERETADQARSRESNCPRPDCNDLEKQVRDAKDSMGRTYQAGSNGSVCQPGMSKGQLQQRAADWLRLAQARARRDQVCYGGGDGYHQTEQATAWNQVSKCQILLRGP